MPCCAPRRNYNGLLPLRDQRELPGVVLVAPRNPLNIGAVARAMANFGFMRLAVVSPYAPHWREARSAIGAPQVLASAMEHATLADAVAGCTLVVGTATLAARKPMQKVVSLPALAPLIRAHLEQGGRIALVFGPEKHGLTRDDLSFCHLLVNVPTDPRQPSMNLGQAVAVCLYEIAARVFSAGAAVPAGSAENAASPATSASLGRLAAVIEEAMTAAGYSPRSMQTANRHDLRVMLRRLHMNAADTRRALGLFRRILWRLQRAAGKRTTPG